MSNCTAQIQSSDTDVTAVHHTHGLRISKLLLTISEDGPTKEKGTASRASRLQAVLSFETAGRIAMRHAVV